MEGMVLEQTLSLILIIFQLFIVPQNQINLRWNVFTMQKNVTIFNLKNAK